MKKRSILAILFVMVLVSSNLLGGCSFGGEKSSDLGSPSNDMTERATDNSEIDTSGDYIGNIECPQPPIDSPYRIINQSDSNECLVIYVSNIDNANFNFYLTKATLVSDDTKTEENVIFEEHVAHYNGDGYYEYIGDDYHLYFRYNPSATEIVGDHTLEVYGLEKLYDSKQYNETITYEETSCLLFIMGLPFAG